MKEQSTPNILQRMVARRDQGGFTLIELLIVIIILAILAAIVVFAVGSTNSNAIASSCNADAKSVETAMESYKAQIGSYPTDISALDVGADCDNDQRCHARPWGPGSRSCPGTSNYTISVDSAGSGVVQVNGAAYEAATNPCNTLKS